jgi:hypothetical protein
MQGSPGLCLAAAAQRSSRQICPAGQAAVTIAQVPSALQDRSVRLPPGVQAAGPQEVPSRSRRQCPLPSQPLLQASLRQEPIGSAPPAGTGWQLPS